MLSGGFGTFGSDLQKDLGALQTTIDTALNTASQVPFLHNQRGDIQEGRAFADTILTDLRGVFDSTPDTTTLASNLFTLLGPGGVLPILAAHDGSGSTPTVSDIIVTNTAGGGFEVDMRLHQGLVDSTLPLGMSLGLPGIPFKVMTTGNVKIQVGFDVELAAVYSPGSGDTFLLDDTKLLQGTDSFDNHQMSLHTKVTLPNTPTPFSATVIVGFLEGALTDHLDSMMNGKTMMNLDFNLDNLGGGGTPTPSLSGAANLDLDFKGGFVDGGNMISDKFPSIGTEFQLNWKFDTGSSDPSTLPVINFEHVTVNLGEFLTRTLGPILTDIQEFTQPLQPLINALKTPIPGLSYLSNLAGQGDVTLETLLKASATAQQGTDYAATVKLLTTVVDVVDQLNAVDFSTANNIGIDLGSFSLGGPNDTQNAGGDLRNLPALLNGGDPNATLGNLSSLIPTATSLASALDSQLDSFGGPVADEIKKALDQLTDPDGIRITTPIFSDPVHSAFKLLLGQDADFVHVDAKFSIHEQESKQFGYAGLLVSFSGGIDIVARASIAYDTYGIRKFLNDPSHNAADFLEGLYVDNHLLNPTNPTDFSRATSFSVGGHIDAGLGVGIPDLISLTINGGVSTGSGGSSPIVFSLHDPNSDSLNDDKLRASELAYDISHFPNCIFDSSGEIDANLFIDFKVGVDLPLVGFVGYEHMFPLGSSVIFDLNHHNNCNPTTPPPPPVLASVDANGLLTLFMGPNAHLRQNVDNTDGDETFEVSHIGGTLGDETVGVTAFGYTQKLQHVKKIFGDGGLGNDSITVDQCVLSDAELHGGVGDDILTYLGSGKAKLIGNAGNDLLTTGPDSQSSELHGGDGNGLLDTVGGNDTLIGGGGADVLFGEGQATDSDTLEAGPGNNQQLFGGKGNDSFLAGKGTSTMYGFGNNDLFTWEAGDGAVAIDGGAGFNILEVNGSANADTVTVGADPMDHHLNVGVNGVTIAATSIQELSLDVRGGADNVTVNDLSQTVLQAVAINLAGEGANNDGAVDTFTVNGPLGPKTINIGEQTVTGMVTTVDQNNTPITKTVTGTLQQVTGLGPTFFFGNPEDKVIINPAAGNDTVIVKTIKIKGAVVVNGNDSTDEYDIQGTGGPTTINTGAGTNTVNIGSTAPAKGGVLQGILADVTVKSGTGPVTLNVDDSGDTTGRTGALTDTKISGLGMGGVINYDPVVTLNITLGSGNDNFSITAIAPNTVTNVDGGGGSDTVDANFAGDFVGSLNLYEFETITIEVGGNFVGRLFASNPGNIQSVTIGGALTSTGLLAGYSVGTMSVGSDLAGEVFMNNSIGSLTVGGSITSTGFVFTGGDLTNLHVVTDLAGTVFVGGKMSSAAIDGNVTATGLLSVKGDLTTLSVGHDIAGQVTVGGNMDSATIGGNVSGLLQVGGNLNTFLVGGDVSGTLQAGGNVMTGHIVGSISGLVFIGGNANLLMVDHDISGKLQVVGTISTLQLGGSVTDPGQVMVGNIVLMTVGGNLAGDVNVVNKLTTLIVQGNTSGTIEAGDIDTIAVYHGIGPIVARITEGGVTRRIEAALPSNPYPLPKTVEATNSIVFPYFYDSRDAANITDPVLGIRVINPNQTRFDLSLVTYSDNAKFELARLDTANALTAANIRNVVVEGDILTGVTTAIANFFGYTATTPGGVRLPVDNVAGVAVRDNVHSGYVQVNTIQSVAFGSLTESSNLTILGSAAGQGDANTMPLGSIVQAHDTYRIAFGDNLTVGEFFATGTNHQFDAKSVLLSDQVKNDPRGAVTALMNAVPFGSTIAIGRIDFFGDGGAVNTQQPVTQAITSTGPLGDVILKGSNGLPNLTAPNIIGNLTITNGPIFGIVQTNGLRTDPITRVVSTVSSDIGRALLDPTGKITGVTTISTGGGITGSLISRGNLISQITGKSISGTVASQGDVGVIQTDASGNAVANASGGLIRFGGINVNGSSSGISGRIVVLGNVYGDIMDAGSLTGRIAVKGHAIAGRPAFEQGILGNVTIKGSVSSSAVLVSEGLIGDDGINSISNDVPGTHLSTGGISGIIAAKGDINWAGATPVNPKVFEAATGANATAIDNIFTNGGVPLGLDVTPYDLVGLNLILQDLNLLNVTNGVLSGTNP